MTKKDYDWIEDKIADIMIEDGPDRHSDGSDIIADFVMALLEGKEDDWWKKYEERCELRDFQRAEYRKKYEQ